jgi:hypothetical protein
MPNGPKNQMFLQGSSIADAGVSHAVMGSWAAK